MTWPERPIRAGRGPWPDTSRDTRVRRLLRLAVEAGCRFSIDSDAHAPGQLDWQPFGCERAARCGVAASRIVNALPADELLAWTRP